MATRAALPTMRGWWPMIAFGVIVLGALLGMGQTFLLMRRLPDQHLWTAIITQLAAVRAAWVAAGNDASKNDVLLGYIFSFVAIDTILVAVLA